MGKTFTVLPTFKTFKMCSDTSFFQSINNLTASVFPMAGALQTTFPCAEWSLPPHLVQVIFCEMRAHMDQLTPPSRGQHPFSHNLTGFPVFRVTGGKRSGLNFVQWKFHREKCVWGKIC